MTLTEWITIGVAAVAAPFVGAILAAIASRMVGNDSNPEALRKAAKPISSLLFWISLVVGLLVILATIKPTVVDNLVTDFVDFIPKILVAVIILIGANVLSTFAITALETLTARMPLGIARKINTFVRAVIITMAALLAVGQIGIDTEVVNMAVAAVLFCLSLSVALLVGLGGRKVASQVASARAIKSLVSVGDKVTVGETVGVVLVFRPTHVEIETEKGGTVLVPSEAFVKREISIERQVAGAEDS